MVPGRAERILRAQPAGWEDNEVGDRGPGALAGGGENGEDTGVRVVVRDRTDGVEAREGVLVRVVGAVPGDDVEGGVILGHAEEAFVEL